MRTLSVKKGQRIRTETLTVTSASPGDKVLKLLVISYDGGYRIPLLIEVE